uniref:UPAR/Ly6 domain-containing protein n=1 Tax=Cynoglossus semilaevis TaxID=244447 RepID=A0A3P8W2L9_CYNSE
MRSTLCVSVLLVLALLHQGEPLVCNYCFGKGSSLCTPTSNQTCSRGVDGCAAVILTGALSANFRSCMNMAVCQGYVQTPGAFATCCSTDLCN